MSKNFMIILAVIIAILVGIFFFSGSKSDNNTNTASTSKATNHVIGQNKKGVVLLEYGDFQCQFCGVYYPTVKQVVSKYGDDIAFQFKNLPLSQIHPNAFAAARAAEAADKQGKYWEMYAVLFERQKLWESTTSPYSTFEGYAKELGLNTNKFKQDYQSSEVNDAINADVAAFKKTGQEQSTPTFFVNGKFIPLSDLADDNGPSLEKFSKVIDDAIASKSQ
jgi:protein-disulfide isomerase